MEPEERAQAGVFLAFQYPVEIPGVTNAYFLRAAYNEIRKAAGLEELDPMDFIDLLEEKLKVVEWGPEIMSRAVNAGFSGGEKKRNEILQMAVLEPKLAILDETDSGLDIDALRIVAAGVNKLRGPDSARSSWSPTTSGCSTTSCPTSCTCCPTAGSSSRAARSWRSSSRRAATSGWRPRRGAGSDRGVSEAVLQDLDRRHGDSREGPEWLEPVRRAAADRFAARRVPRLRATRSGASRPIAPIAQDHLAPVARRGGRGRRPSSWRRSSSAMPSGAPLVFVNGGFSAALSRGHGAAARASGWAAWPRRCAATGPCSGPHLDASCAGRWERPSPRSTPPFRDGGVVHVPAGARPRAAGPPALRHDGRTPRAPRSTRAT